MPETPQLIAYRQKLANHIDNIESLRALTFDLGGASAAAAAVVGKLAEGKTSAEELADTADDAQKVLTLTGKVGALKTPSAVLKNAAERVETVADKVAGDMDEALSKPGVEEANDDPFLRGVQKALNEASTILLTQSATAYANGILLRNDLDSIDQMIDALTAEPRPFDSGTDVSALDAMLSELALQVEAQATDRIDLVPDGEFSYPTILDKLEALQDVIGTIDFDEIDLSIGGLQRLVLQFDFLSAPLDAVASLLEPIEPALEAADAVLNVLLAPVNALIEELGVADELAKLTDFITGDLPGIDVIEPLLLLVEDLQARLDDLADNLFRLPDFYSYSNDLRIGDVQEGPTGIGVPQAETLEGSPGDDVLDAREGDDRVEAGRGDDLIVASEGNDTVDGGDGIDTLRLEGNFNQYELAREAATNRIVITHVAPQGDVQDEGTETIQNIEFVMFANVTFTGAQLESSVIGPSILNGSGESEMMFLNSNGTLNARGRFEANGFDGNDTIFGSTQVDELNGGRGNDVLLGGLGNDILNGGASGIPVAADGRDTFRVLDDNTRGQHSADLVEGIARGEGTDVLISIENVVFGPDGAHEVRGNRENNSLITNAGEDLVAGDAGNDYIATDEGRDFLIGGMGRDTLIGGTQNDILVVGGVHEAFTSIFDGGADLDRLSYSNDYGELEEHIQHLSPNERNEVRNFLTETVRTPGSIRLDTGSGIVEKLAAPGGPVIGTDRFSGIEFFTGSDSADILRGSYDPDAVIPVQLDGAGGNDLIFTDGVGTADGGSGDDTIRVTEETVDAGLTLNVSGGNGFDTLDLRGIGNARWRYEDQGASNKSLRAFDPNRPDSLANQTSGAFVEIRFFDGGIERVFFSDAATYIRNSPPGPQEVDFVLGAGDDEVLHTGGGGVYRAGAGNDSFRVSSNATILGEQGNDTVEVNGAVGLNFQGGAGNDFVSVNTGSGRLDGQAGFDTFHAEELFGRGLVVDLAAGIADGFAVDPRDSRFSQTIDFTLTGFEGIIGSDGNDTLTGDDGVNRIQGQDGRDMIMGAGGADVLYGGDGIDTLLGGSGDDRLHGGLGNDTLSGDAGSDTVLYTNAVPGTETGGLVANGFGAIRADLELQRVTGGFGTDQLSSIENVYGGVGNDTLIGNVQNNVLSGEAGNDSVTGLGGDDLLITGGGNDTADGGAGDDRVLVGLGNATLRGGSGEDTLQFGSLEGRLTISFADGRYFGALADTRPVWTDTGTEEERVFDGQSLRPDDVLRSAPAQATSASDLGVRLPNPDSEAAARFLIRQEAVETVVRGSFTGFEKVTGGVAVNRLLPTAAVEVYDGSASQMDIVDISRLTSAAAIDLGRGLFSAALVNTDVLTGIEGVFSGAAADTLVGNDVANHLNGGAGGDDLLGLLGADTLEGGAGSDLLNGEAVAARDRITGEVYRLYQATLDRAPDDRGLLNWTERREEGLSLDRAASGFAGSQEFQNLYGNTTNGEFVSLLYQNVLDRDPDQTGLENWTTRLDDGASRGSVVVGFSQSQEFITTSAGGALDVSVAARQDGYADDVFRLYQATLDRTPDQTGLYNWTKRMAEGSSFVEIAAGFTGSREFQNLYGNTTNESFVTLLYENVLDRGPDAQGLENWTGRLEEELLTRDGVVEGFAQSQEFIRNSAENFENYMRSITDDDLSGGPGDDILLGGLFADTFRFNAAEDGADQVAGLDRWDTIVMSQFGYDDKGDVFDHVTVAEDALIFSDQGVRITFHQTTLNELDAVAFEFV